MVSPGSSNVLLIMLFISLCHSAVAGRGGASAGGEAEGGISSIWRTEQAQAEPCASTQPLCSSFRCPPLLPGWLAGHKQTLQVSIIKCAHLPSLCPSCFFALHVYFNGSASSSRPLRAALEPPVHPYAGWTLAPNTPLGTWNHALTNSCGGRAGAKVGRAGAGF